MPKFEIDFLAEYSDEALLCELRRIAARLPSGEPLTQAVYKLYSPKASVQTVRRRFGGWKEALGCAGLAELYSGQPVSQKMRSQLAVALSDIDLLNELKRVHALVAKGWLTSGDFNEHSMIGEDAIRGRFGTFGEGLDAAGIPRHRLNVKQFTDQQCFENLAEVWTHFGRVPAYRDMCVSPSKIQGKTYISRWATWRKALKAFVDWANAGDEPQEPNVLDDGCEKAARRANRTEADCREVRPGLRFNVFRRDRFRCIACGRSPAIHLDCELHADHILAVVSGGKTTLENLQTLCRDCNLGKGRS